ncbi:MAG: NUDIX hydrolase [Spirochaetes bacterium]|nr:NUDIX hydrolase [Spirochaetota bacterium]
MVAGDGSGSLAWKTLSKEEVYSGSVFTVFEKLCEGPGGRKGRFSVLEANDWAVVVPLIRSPGSPEFLMVRQYRHGSDASSLEFPGGLVETGEEPLAAAARELAEETGWVSETIIHAGSVYPNPAIQSNRFHVFLAVDPEPSVERNLDEHEVVDALLVPAASVMDAMGEGEMSHALMATALFLVQRLTRKLGLANLWV